MPELPSYFSKAGRLMEFVWMNRCPEAKSLLLTHSSNCSRDSYAIIKGILKIPIKLRKNEREPSLISEDVMLFRTDCWYFSKLERGFLRNHYLQFLFSKTYGQPSNPLEMTQNEVQQVIIFLAPFMNPGRILRNSFRRQKHQICTQQIISVSGSPALLLAAYPSLRLIILVQESFDTLHQFLLLKCCTFLLLKPESSFFQSIRLLEERAR